jgi:hypothetical protein
MTRWGIIRSLLRRAWMRDPERFAVLNDAKTKRPNKSDNKRLKWEHKCNICKKWFPAKEISVDHITPCGTFLKDEHWKTFGPALFCSRTKLQKACKGCHNIKTKQERNNENN